MTPLRVLTILAAIAAAYAQTSPQPINDLPNPYRTVRDWGKPPGGVPWAAVTAVEVSPDGSIYVIHRCKDNSCAGRPDQPQNVMGRGIPKLCINQCKDRASLAQNTTHFQQYVLVLRDAGQILVQAPDLYLPAFHLPFARNHPGWRKTDIDQRVQHRVHERKVNRADDYSAVMQACVD